MSSLLIVICILFSHIALNTSHTCIHHNVSHYEVPVLAVPHHRSRFQRHVATFQPLNIHVHRDFDEKMQHDVVLRIDGALKKVVNFFKEALEVRQTLSPFLLERQNCAQKWQSGVNKDRCSRLKFGPEFCSTKLTDYIIPDQYLNELEVYDYTDIHPQRVLKSGQGVQEANFILFVISRTTSWCAESDVQAYGSYCRLDSDNRPVAGLLNLCPSKFTKKVFRPSHYFNVIMHEVIHILGFSHHLYSKFKTCSAGHDCVTPKRIAHRDSQDILRLVFPELVKSTQAYFNCSDSDFGAPLQQYEGNSSITNEDKYTSHWHPSLMYSSIMTPWLSEDSYVVIDNITLSLLYSTGWYKVNFEKAQKFTFGKGQGCNFGFEDKCQVSDQRCLTSKNATRCDILEFTFGKCENVIPYHPCIYKTNQDGTCSDFSERIQALNLHPFECERFVLLEESKNMEDSLCMVTQCKTIKRSEVSVNSSEIACPQKTLNERRSICLNDKGLVISVHMYFSNSTFPKEIAIHDFKVNMVQEIAQALNITTSNIVNVTLSVLEMTELGFYICPPSNISEDELVLLIKKTQDCLQYSYIRIWNGSEKNALATEIIIEPDGVAVSSCHMFLSIWPLMVLMFVMITTDN